MKSPKNANQGKAMRRYSKYPMKTPQSTISFKIGTK